MAVSVRRAPAARGQSDAAADPQQQERGHHEGVPAGSQLGDKAQPDDAHAHLPPAQRHRGQVHPHHLGTVRTARQGG